MEGLTELITKLQTQALVIANYEKNKCQSDDQEELYKALCSAQNEFNSVGKDAQNNYQRFKYSTLDNLFRQTLPILTTHGLCIIQRTSYRNNEHFLTTRLCHISGQWIEAEAKIDPVKIVKGGGEMTTKEMQTFGAHITYLRRYEYMAICGISCSDDPTDDDGARDKLNHTPEVKNPSGLNREQLQEVSRLLNMCPEFSTSLFKTYQVKKMVDLPVKDYENIINGLQTYINDKNRK